MIGALDGATTLGVHGAFSATTQNAGNEISTGTVSLGDDDQGVAMFRVADAKPGDTWTRCINVTYTGSLRADVKNYLRSTPGPLSPHMHLKLERGTQTTAAFPDCETFTPSADGGTVYDDALSHPSMPRDQATAITESPVEKTVWDRGDSLALRITLSLDADTPNSAQGHNTGDATIVWEATGR